MSDLRGLDGVAHAAVIAGQVCYFEPNELARIADAATRIAAREQQRLVAMAWGDLRDEAPVAPDHFIVVVGIEVAHVTREGDEAAAAAWASAASFSDDQLRDAVTTAEAKVPEWLREIGEALGLRLEGERDCEALLVAAGPGCVAWLETPASGQIGTVADETPEIVGVEAGAYRLAIEIE
jgi:hypothetical protein